jgi:hypothetical protein
MKQLLISLMLLLAIPAFSQVGNPGLSITKEEISLTIDRNTTRDQIETYKKELKKHNISFNLYQAQFSKENRLVSATMSVNCNDGFQGSLSKTFSGPGDRIGFYRIYTKGAKSAFGLIKPAAPEKPVPTDRLKKEQNALNHINEGGTPIVEKKK